MSAKIFKIGDSDSTPELMLDMIKANIPNMKSVVVSVIWEEDGSECQSTYYSLAKHNDLAYHAVCVDAYLKKVLMDD